MEIWGGEGKRIESRYFNTININVPTECTQILTQISDLEHVCWLILLGE